MQKRLVYGKPTIKQYPLYSEIVLNSLEGYPLGATFKMLLRITKFEVNTLFDTIRLLLTQKKIRVKTHHGKFIIQKLFA